MLRKWKEDLVPILAHFSNTKETYVGLMLQQVEGVDVGIGVWGNFSWNMR